MCIFMLRITIHIQYFFIKSARFIQSQFMFMEITRSNIILVMVLISLSIQTQFMIMESARSISHIFLYLSIYLCYWLLLRLRFSYISINFSVMFISFRWDNKKFISSMVNDSMSASSGKIFRICTYPWGWIDQAQSCSQLWNRCNQ